MIVQAKFKTVHWMMLAVFALMATAVLAQQTNVSQSQSQPDQDQPGAAQRQTEKAQAQTEAAQKQTEDAQAKTQEQEDGKLISVPGGKALGMSILGNQEAPKALVIVPWKRSELGNVPGISTMLDDSRQPIDKEVFMRMLSYYEIRSETARPGSAPAERNAAQPNTAKQRRKP
jgi:hypothetical protein